MEDKLIKPARSWKKCVKLAFEFYGDRCLYTRKGLPWIGYFGVVDPAHIFGRGAYPHMKLIPLNVIPLDRYVHTMLDIYKDPGSNKSLTKYERADIFKMLVGYKIYAELEHIAKE